VVVVGSQIDAGNLKDEHPDAPVALRTKHLSTRDRVLVVENDESLRDSVGQLLVERGYEVSFADDGSEALHLLHAGLVPDLIVLDLRMPVMDGWQFRAIQKDDPQLGLIPVLAISADTSPKAAAISAQGYLRKPFDSKELMVVVERVLAENNDRIAARQDETQRLASLGRLAANVGHEINNPLAFVMLYLRQSLDELRSSIRSMGVGQALPEADVVSVKAGLVNITDMLQECEIGGERIRATVATLQQLSHRPIAECGPLDVRMLIEESSAMAANQIRHRAHFTKRIGHDGLVRGNRAALGQVFLNLLINAAQSIPEGDAEHNNIQILTKNVIGAVGHEVMIEVSDSGLGMSPEVIARIFEPYFTTKPLGEGTGLGLSISRQTIADHGGRVTVESEVGKGTVFRIFLPVDSSLVVSRSVPTSVTVTAIVRRGRILVVDDEPLIGRVIGTALKSEHDIVAVSHAADALALLEQGHEFDVVLCDLVMPDISGPEFYAKVKASWPALAARLVFMTGGAFTPRTVEFMKCVPTSVLCKPFALDELRRVVRDHVQTGA
jgi:two-component system NtrC family sensor kinase